jgi:hypothetical protein
MLWRRQRVDDNWLEISDQNISVEGIMRRIRERAARHDNISLSEEERPEDIAEALWGETVGDTGGESVLSRWVSIRQNDCDIVPRHYVIDWRMPILGPIHAVVRRVINAEIRRYLSPSLKKQSHFNRKVLRALRGLARENACLRQQIEELRNTEE